MTPVLGHCFPEGDTTAQLSGNGDCMFYKNDLWWVLCRLNHIQENWTQISDSTVKPEISQNCCRRCQRGRKRQANRTSRYLPVWTFFVRVGDVHPQNKTQHAAECIVFASEECDGRTVFKSGR